MFSLKWDGYDLYFNLFLLGHHFNVSELTKYQFPTPHQGCLNHLGSNTSARLSSIRSNPVPSLEFIAGELTSFDLPQAIHVSGLAATHPAEQGHHRAQRVHQEDRRVLEVITKNPF